MQSPPTTDKGKLRMEKLRQLELEQLQWEQEALVMPEDLNRALFLSFESVKTEFSDLDGLSWPRYPVPLVTNPWAIDEPTPKLTCTEMDECPTASDSADTCTPAHSPKSPSNHSPQLSRSLSYVPCDTIRISRHAQLSRGPLQPANQFCLTRYGASHGDSQGPPYTLPSTHPQNLACHNTSRLSTQLNPLRTHQ